MGVTEQFLLKENITGLLAFIPLSSRAFYFARASCLVLLKGGCKHANLAAKESLRSGGVGCVIAPALGFMAVWLARRRRKVEGKLAGVVEIDGLSSTCGFGPGAMSARGVGMLQQVPAGTSN